MTLLKQKRIWTRLVMLALAGALFTASAIARLGETVFP